jgi:hypothetical protein
MTDRKLPPSCPICAGPTTLKEMRKLTKAQSFMCFFRCMACSLEYPLRLGAAEMAQAALQYVAPKLPGAGADQ